MEQGYRILSDLHLEFHHDSSPRKWAKIITPSEPEDVMILAGDICTVNTPGCRDLLQRFLIWCRSRWNRVIYVPGNHEYYGLSITEGNEYLKEICEITEVILLNPGVYQVGSTKIIGATLWSNVPLVDQLIVEDGISDFGRIKGNSIEAHNNRFHVESEYIRYELDHLSPSENAIVVTHHVPDRDTARLASFLTGSFFEGLDLSSAYGTDIPDIKRYSDRILFWVYGHSHINSRLFIYDIVLTCNQLGYHWVRSEKVDYIPSLRLVTT